jgi:hypothetical protein
VGRAVCACLGKRCVLFYFLQVLSRIPPVFRGTLRAVPDNKTLEVQQSSEK